MNKFWKLITSKKTLGLAAVIGVIFTPLQFFKGNNVPVEDRSIKDSNIAMNNTAPVTQNIYKTIPPRLGYEIFSPSTLGSDGVYHTQFYTTAGFAVGAPKDGNIIVVADPNINPTLRCIATSTLPVEIDPSVPAGKMEGAMSPLNHLWNCTSSTPVVDDGKLFRYTSQTEGAKNH